MGPKTTPSLISKGGIRSPPLAWDEIDTPWEIGLIKLVEQSWQPKQSKH